MRKPTKIRKHRARAAAIWFLRELGLEAPPVPARKIIKKLGRLFYFHNWQGPDFAKEEGFSYLDEDGTYRIYINKDLPAGRDNFTYAHETAHIVLKHHEEFDVDYLTDPEYKILDREADIFAAELLMPKEWVLQAVRYPITVREIGRLKGLFEVSWEAMINRLDELNICSKEECERLFEEWRQAQCNYKAEIPAVMELAFTLEGGLVEMPPNIASKRFIFPEVDGNMRFTKCPICGNTDFSPNARYCKKCGQYLYNSCTNAPYAEPQWCGKDNVADALFCEYCGAKTTMYELLERLGLIKQELSNKEAAAALEEDDLPF